MRVVGKARITGGLAVLACCVAIALAALGLVACGGSSDKDNFTGTWDLYEVQSKDESQAMTHDTVMDLQNSNKPVFLNLNEDGTAQYLLFSSEMSGTWQVTGSSEATVTLDGTDYALKVDSDGRLELVDGDQTRVFERGKAKNPDDYAVKTVDKVKDESFKAITIADDKTCKAVATSCYSDEYGDPGYKIKVANKSSRTVYFTCDDDFTVDGSAASLVGSIQVDPGKSASSFFYFDKNVLGGGLDKLKNVKGSFKVLDVKEYGEIASYKFSANND